MECPIDTNTAFDGLMRHHTKKGLALRVIKQHYEIAQLRAALDQQLTQLQLLANLADDPIVESTIDASAEMLSAHV